MAGDIGLLDTEKNYMIVVTKDGKLTGRQVDLPIETLRIARGGLVEGSLGDALEGLRGGDEEDLHRPQPRVAGSR